ncbi:hypothetical protein FRC10_009115 [Ceratobasidium sp. 414]|nr:hypothetical protein FRC10_009115 [Ceratobasidium sp. 414]
MVAFTPRFTSLLVIGLSSSMVMSGVEALPQARQVYVYADDPLVVSGDGNHVHAHMDKRHHGHHHHEDHHHHGHDETKVYADDPLVVSGDGNHIHSHSHKRAIVDPLIPLLGNIPGVPGIIDLVNVASHVVLSEKLASLIISPKPNGVAPQSITGDDGTSGFVINASNSSSSVMYLLPQSISTSLAPSQQPVLITMPMFNGTEKGLKMYCVSYNPSPSGPVQMSSQPCMTNTTAPSDNTPSQTSQLFSWNTQSGEITPLWHKDVTQPLVDTTSAPGGAPDPASQGNGFVVGQSATSTPSGTIAMVFRSIEHHPSEGSTMASMANGEEDDSPASTASAQETSTVVALEASTGVSSATGTPSAAAMSAAPSSTVS